MDVFLDERKIVSTVLLLFFKTIQLGTRKSREGATEALSAFFSQHPLWLENNYRHVVRYVKDSYAFTPASKILALLTEITGIVSFGDLL